MFKPIQDAQNLSESCRRLKARYSRPNHDAVHLDWDEKVQVIAAIWRLVSASLFVSSSREHDLC